MIIKLFYIILCFLFKIRHQFFEIINKSILVKDIKFFIKKIIPENIFEYFRNKKINKLIEFPESFSIETVNICNAKCWFCPQPNHERKKGYMEFDLYKKIIDEISEHANKVKSIALFMDGEPTLHKKLIDFLVYAKTKNLKKIYLSSNMQFFTKKLIDEIFAKELQGTLQYVICSLDGVSETTHNANRIGVDTAKAYENTEYLIKTKNKNLSIYPWVFPRMLINETNKHEEEDFYNFWKNKADKVLRTTMHNWGSQIKDDRLFENQDKFSSTCFFPFSQFFIQLNGQVRLCCLDVNGKNIYGDLNEFSISDIWSNIDFQNLRNNFISKNKSALPELCHNCDYPSKGQWSLPFFWEKNVGDL